MTIKTRDFGEIEIEESKVFSFPNGIFAFEEHTRFALISPLGENVYPMWLQSLNDPALCFIVFDPSIIDDSYIVTLNQSEKKLLETDDDTAIRTLAIARVPEDYRKTTVNMKSPIVINADKNIATQIILPHDYPFRLPIYEKQEVK